MNNLNWYQKILTRLYVRYVVIPTLKSSDEIDGEVVSVEPSFTVEFFPAEEMIAQMEAEEETKH